MEKMWIIRNKHVVGGGGGGGGGRGGVYLSQPVRN